MVQSLNLIIRNLTLILLGTLISLQNHAQYDSTVSHYINTYKDIAMLEMVRTGVPASITLAQGILEAGAGKSILVLKSNNHFGIKCKSNWTGDRVYKDDDARDECFRKYATAEESFKDHSDFLKNNTRYAFLFNLDPTDYISWAYGLKQAGYATEARYGQLLIQCIEKYHLQDYTLLVLDAIAHEQEPYNITNN